MDVKQIYPLVNQAFKESVGETAVLTEDLSNLVDLGNEVFNINAVDRYCKSLINQIGQFVFVNRPYQGSIPSIMRDGWEFGSIMMKVDSDIPEVTENESWELEAGSTYDPNQFNPMKASAKFFNSKVTFEIDKSFTELQLKQSFQSAAQLNGFISMLYERIETALTVALENLAMRLINTMTGETLNDAAADGKYGNVSTTRAVNLLKLYKAQNTTATVTAENAIYDPGFLRFATYTMALYKKRMAKLSTLFNIGGRARYTPADRLHVVLLDEFKQAAGVYLENGTGQFKTDSLALPEAESVACWQGSGTDWAFSSTSAINAKLSDGDTVSVAGVLGVMFDTFTLAICNEDRRIHTHFNPKAEFVNWFYKQDVSYLADPNENYVVFYVADPVT